MSFRAVLLFAFAGMSWLSVEYAHCDAPPEAGVMASPVVGWDNTLQGESRFRFLGPFYEVRRGADGSTFRAFRPFFAKVSEPAKRNEFTEVLWPLSSFRVTRGQGSWRVLVAYGQDNDVAKEDSPEKLVVFPFYFSGKTREGESYRALFPIAGRICGLLTLDRFDFFLFPIYGKAWKDDIVGTYFLWPFVTWAKGKEVKRFRIFPFYGFSRNGEDWTKRFIMWPFWNSVIYGGKHPRGGGFIFWPFFGRVKLDDQRTWMILPPLCRFSSNDRGYRYRLIWPFIQYERRGGYGRTYLWPLWGRRYWPNRIKTFVLWPVGGYEVEDRIHLIRKRLRILPFLFYERDLSKEVDDEGDREVISRYTCLWPLGSYERSPSDDTLLRVPNLWPMRRMKQVERNFAPFWTLYQRQHVGDTTEHELLWGLFRTRKSPVSRSSHLFPIYAYHRANEPQDEHRWSFLGGLVGRSRVAESVRWRLLWLIKFGDDPGEEGNR